MTRSRCSVGPDARLQAIIGLLEEGPHSTRGILARLQEAGWRIHRRQVFSDMATLVDRLGRDRVSSVPWRRLAGPRPDGMERDRTFWILAPGPAPSVSDPGTLVLDSDTVLALALARRLLAGATPAGTPLSQALDRLALRLGADRPLDQVTVSDFGQQAVEPSVFRICLDGVHGRRRIGLQYRPLGVPEVESLEGWPVHLTLIEGAWFLLLIPSGPRRESGTSRLVRLSCICAAGMAPSVPWDPEPGVEDRQRALDRHALAFRGMMSGAKIQVALHVSSRVLEMVARSPWSRSQRIKRDQRPGPRPHLVSFVTTGAEAVVPWVLQFEGEVEVTRPGALRAAIRDCATALAESADIARDPAPIPMLDDTGSPPPMQGWLACTPSRPSLDEVAPAEVEDLHVDQRGVALQVTYRRSPTPSSARARRGRQSRPPAVLGS
jgi:predicted DNA-binding transcriptional regulator YafY